MLTGLENHCLCRFTLEYAAQPSPGRLIGIAAIAQVLLELFPLGGLFASGCLGRILAAN